MCVCVWVYLCVCVCVGGGQRGGTCICCGLHVEVRGRFRSQVSPFIFEAVSLVALFQLIYSRILSPLSPSHLQEGELELHFPWHSNGLLTLIPETKLRSSDYYDKCFVRPDYAQVAIPTNPSSHSQTLPGSWLRAVSTNLSSRYSDFQPGKMSLQAQTHQGSAPGHISCPLTPSSLPVGERESLAVGLCWNFSQKPTEELYHMDPIPLSPTAILSLC